MLGTPGVLTAHAALQDASLSPEEAPFDLDDPRFDLRLRVGSFSHLGDEVPAGGASQSPPGGAPSPTDPRFVDVLVNSGCNVRECRPVPEGLTLSGAYGFGTLPLPLTQSSFVTPLLTAELVAMRQRPPLDTLAWGDDLIGILERRLRGTCDDPPCHRDPLLHGVITGP